ncbi:MAG TPA: hypothetical protein VJY35_06710, partial [Candidatus Eisenbacteria bacterium]|nr:hypothetical protein [Candidatus Eisenbacteria bacterium]
MIPKVFLVAVATIVLATPAGAQLVDPAFPVTDGDVYATAIDGNTLYIGGVFNFVGPYTGGYVALDGVTGAANTGWPKVAGVVRTCVSDGAGGWYIGGTFTSVHGVPRVNLAHILADGSVSPWNPGALGGGPNGYVQSIVVSGSLVYVGGFFSLVGGQPRLYLAAVDAVTGAATSWNPGADNSVFSLAVVGSTVYAGGFFSTIGGQPRTGLAAIQASDGVVTAWDPALNMFGSVLSLATSGSTLYVGGQFSTIGGQPRNNLAAIDTGTGLPTVWNPN